MRLTFIPFAAAIVAASASKPRKNLLYIISDDLRPELNLAYRQTHMLTPHLDRLASKSVAFLAYAQVAVCCPSRSSFMTGRRPNATKVLWNGDQDFRHDGVDGDQWHTVPGWLKNNGWVTLGGGKTFHPDNPPNWDGNRSFDRVPPLGRPYFPFSYNLKDKHCPNAGKKVVIPGEPVSGIDTWCPLPASSPVQPDNDLFYDSTLAADAEKALRFAAASATPFAVYVGFARPHVPHRVPKPLFDHYYATLNLTSHPDPPEGMPPIAYHRQGLYNYSTWDDPVGGWFVPNFTTVLTDEQQRTARAAYYASVTWMDMQVGRLLNVLDSLSLWDNTTIAFHGDHGWELTEFSMLHKETVLELGTRVPLLVYDPDTPQSSQGQRSSYLAELVDMGRTVFDLVGAPDPDSEPAAAPFEGRSLRPALQQPQGPWPEGAGTTAFSQFGRCVRPGQPEWLDDPIQGCDTKKGQTPLMGYTVRTPDWRHTRWMDFNMTTLTTDWSKQPYAMELYSHTGDDGTTFDKFETINVVSDPSHAQVVQTLGQVLKAMFDV